jgi:AcrR family transcriptional regulator
MARRPTRWGADAPATEADARDRILLAAQRCYQRHGVLRTTVDDIAREAHIHRTTVYSYFRNRDEVLAGVFAQDMRPIIATSERIMSGPGPFADRLVASFMQAYDGIRGSQFLSLLFDRENADFTVRAAFASELLHRRTHEALTRYVAAAMANGEVRDDVPAEALASWLMHVHTMLMTDTPQESEGGPAGVLRRFVVASIAPTAAAAGSADLPGRRTPRRAPTRRAVAR